MKIIINLCLLCTFSLSYSMNPMRVSEEKTRPSNDFLEALAKSRNLLPENMKTTGYHNELALDCYNKLCCVPDPEPRLYADELLHLRNEQPLDQDLATLIIKECFSHSRCYEYTLDDDPYHIHMGHKVFTYDTDAATSLILAKAAATKLGRPYKILPVSTLHNYDLQELLHVIYSEEKPYTVILHELNDKQNIYVVKTFIERYERRNHNVHLLMTSRHYYDLPYNNTTSEWTKELSCSGRLHLLKHYLDKLPIKTDKTCSEAYLTSVAKRTHGFSADKIERLAEAILLTSLGKPEQTDDITITQKDIETVLKEDYGITWLKGIYASLSSH